MAARQHVAFCRLTLANVDDAIEKVGFAVLATEGLFGRRERVSEGFKGEGRRAIGRKEREKGNRGALGVGKVGSLRCTLDMMAS